MAISDRMKHVESYELAWAEALAQEHRHQRELLAALRGELGTFAGECAAALTALDALVDLGGVAGLLDIAKAGRQNATLLHEVGRRLPGLSRADTHRNDEASAFYTGFDQGGVGQQDLVHQAGELLKAEPARSDRELLNAIVDAAGVRSVIEQVVGPAAVAALGALAPLARWAPSFARLGAGEGGREELVPAARKDLTTVLHSTAAGAGDAIAGETIALRDSLRETVEHVEHAARIVAKGRLEKAIAEARRQLEADLDELRAVHEQAEHAPHAWHSARRTEHSGLVEEVREKLEKVESLRRALGLILPHLQLTARALATVEKLRSVEGQLDPSSAAGLDAARMSLLLAAAEAWEASLPESRHAVIAARPPLPMRWLVAAALVLAAAAVAIAVTLTGGSKKTDAPNTILNVTPATGVPPAPKLTRISSTFNPAQRATYYSVGANASRQGKLIYTWHLSPPKYNPTCDKFGSVFGSPNRAVWHHSGTDGCSHIGLTGNQHTGTVTVTITTRYWQCTTSFFGTLTANGGPPKACTRV
jgi:hypothetical protein